MRPKSKCVGVERANNKYIMKIFFCWIGIGLKHIIKLGSKGIVKFGPKTFFNRKISDQR